MEYEGPRPKPIFLGLALITIGVLFLAREIWNLPEVRLWTLVWLGLGSWLFVGTLAGNRKGWFWPLTLLTIGIYMLLADIGPLPDDAAIWPVVLIVIGIAIFLQATIGKRKSDRSEILPPDEPRPWDPI